MSTVSTTEATLCHSSGEVIGNWRDYAGGSRADNPRDRKPWLWSGTDGAGVKESSDYQCRLLLARCARVWLCLANRQQTAGTRRVHQVEGSRARRTLKPELLDEPCRPLDVGEEEGDRAARNLCHSE